MQSQYDILLWYSAKWFQAYFNKDNVLANVNCQYKSVYFAQWK